MVTEINNNEGSSAWIGISLVIIVIALVAIFVWPGFYRVGNSVPAGGSTVQINVPPSGASNPGAAAPAAPAGGTAPAY